MMKNAATSRRERSPPKRAAVPTTAVENKLDSRERGEVHTSAPRADVSHPKLKAIFPPPSPEPNYESSDLPSNSCSTNVIPSNLSTEGRTGTNLHEDFTNSLGNTSNARKQGAADDLSLATSDGPHRGCSPPPSTNVSTSASTSRESETSKLGSNSRIDSKATGVKVAVSAEAQRALHAAHRHFLEEARQLEAELDAVMAAVARAMSNNSEQVGI